MDEDWDEVLSSSELVPFKLSDRLMYLFYIPHRSYLTPIRLSKYKPGYSLACPKCGDPRGTFYHLLWSCPSFQCYWSQVVEFLHDCMGSPLTLCPCQCLQGLLSISEEKHLNIFLQESLFPSRMQIALDQGLASYHVKLDQGC